MAIRKYRKKMNGGNVWEKLKQGKTDSVNMAKDLNEKRKRAQEEAKVSAENAKNSYKIAMRSGSTGGTHLQPPAMNNLNIPPHMPPSPPQLGGKRRRRRTRRRRKHKSKRRKTRRRRKRKRTRRRRR